MRFVVDHAGEASAEKLVFDHYTVPAVVAQDHLFVTLRKDGGKLLYSRKLGEEVLEKTLLARDGRLLFNPVEPINKPKEISPFLLVQFEQALLVQAKETTEIMVTFPVEIASIFVNGDQGMTVLDIFCLTAPRYTLYGSPITGMICRYWKSPVYLEPPMVVPFREGLLELTIQNATNRWVEVHKAVFSAHEMKIYHDLQQVAMRGYMKIQSDNTAETGLINEAPSLTGIQAKKAVELLSSRKHLMVGSRLLMEEGL